MVTVHSFEDFNKFVTKAKELNLPYQIIGSQYDLGPSPLGLKQIPKVTRFQFCYVLCCSIFTVIFRSIVSYEEKNSIIEKASIYEIERFNDVRILNGIIDCK